MSERSVAKAIKKAERILPGKKAPDGDADPRWQAMIVISHYIESCPLEVWDFVWKWGRHRNANLRTAVACCLLEHLLAEHFDLIFPRVQDGVRKSKLFSDTFLRCWKIGQAVLTKNSIKFDRLERWCLSR
ncbi:MAG TPA: hypothetical protein VKX17_14485 [Planctomycetota bacterium]|nr:hypothetical protein [Planctomycetota bacterium]